MKQNHTSPVVLENACGALQSMTVNPENKVIAGKAGAVQVVLDTMKRHANHAGVVTIACVVLWEMAKNAATRATILAHGGVAAALVAKRNYPGDADLQKKADGLLAALQ